MNRPALPRWFYGFALMTTALTLGWVPMGARAGQGVERALYTSPNTSFIINPAGDSTVTVNDTSGSIATLQTEINSARTANPGSIVIIRLQTNTTYTVSSAGLVLGSQECLVAGTAVIQAANSSVTVPLIQISSGATNVSVAGGMLNANGANINGILASAAARVNVDKVTVKNCGLDGILLEGHGNATFDNEMTVTRCEASGSPAHAGISIQNCTQAAVLDNFCHGNAVGIWIACAYGNFDNNVCTTNTTGIDFASGDDNVIANNTCNNNGTGILLAGTASIVASDSLGANSTAGLRSAGSGNIFADNLFTAGNTTNFVSNGSGDMIVAYKGAINAPGQNYFYPPLINDQHTNVIVNGMGRTDVTNSSGTIDAVQTAYNAAKTANPNNVIVLHLNGNFTVGATPLTLQSNSCVLLNGSIQINSATAASAAITGGTTPARVSISGGVIDGTNLTGNNGIYIPSGSMLQVDAVTLQNFGADNPREGNSDVVRFTAGGTPQIITRCFINGGAARGIWLENSGVKRIVSDNEVTAVNMDGVDCDASTSGSLVKFNYCHDLVRYGVFFEQSASYDTALGDVCNNDGRDINIYNNSVTPRGDTAFNNVLCNALLGSNALRNGSTGTNVVQSSHNFIFDNAVVNATISSELYGVQNYYSQNYLAGGTLSTAGTEAFFNSPDVSSNLFIQDGNSGLAVLAASAATSNGTPIVINTASGLGNDQWALVPTDSGWVRITNLKSQSVMAVKGASLSAGAAVIQYTFGSAKNDQWMAVSVGNGLYYFSNRLSGLCLDVPSATGGTQLVQEPYTGGANQQFRMPLTAPVAGPGPTMSLHKQVGNSLTFSGGSGIPNWNFYVLNSTNLGLPLAQWQSVATNAFDGSGNFNFTNGFNPNSSQSFYILKLQ